jgi:hypothetical protein
MAIESLDSLLMANFYTYAEAKLPDDHLNQFIRLRQLTDLRRPSEWHIGARATRR